MGDTYIKVIPQRVSSDEVETITDKLIDYLTERKIIKPIVTNPSNGNAVYPPGENYRQVLSRQDHAVLNGVELIAGERTVFWGDMEKIMCPQCGNDMIDLEWGNAIDEWIKNTGNDKIECPNCKSVNSVADLIFEPTWAFGELGLIFWNWDFIKEEFFKDLERLINKEIKVVYGKL